MNFFKSMLNYNYDLCNKFKLQNVVHCIATVVRSKTYGNGNCFEFFADNKIVSTIFDLPSAIYRRSNTITEERYKNIPFKSGKFYGYSTMVLCPNYRIEWSWISQKNIKMYKLSSDILEFITTNTQNGNFITGRLCRDGLESENNILKPGDTLPAKTIFENLTKIYTEEWYSSSRLFRPNDLPSRVITTEFNRIEEWYLDGKLGRPNKKLPVRIVTPKCGEIEYWYQ